MSILVAVKSCHRDREAGFHDAIRETWGSELKKCGVQVMFFMGEHPNLLQKRTVVTLQRDEIILGCSDEYNALPHKTRAITQWMAPKKLDHLFLCDNDTVINVKGLLALPYEAFDYSGHFSGGINEIGRTFYYKDQMGEYPESHPWASGGLGYFLSMPAVHLVADKFPKVWAEDMFVGQVLGPEIMKGNLMAMALEMNRIATWHYPKTEKYPKFTPNILRGLYVNGEPRWN